MSLSAMPAIVAVYESDDLMHGLLCEWLSGAGHIVRDATKTHDRASRRPDLVIVSISCPKREIDMLMRVVRSVHPGTPIVALSSQARLGLSSNGGLARELGVERVMAKPLTRKELVGAVDAILTARSHAS
jgi:DNA-binding response OmpR family regulator